MVASFTSDQMPISSYSGFTLALCFAQRTVRATIRIVNMTQSFGETAHRTNPLSWRSGSG